MMVFAKSFKNDIPQIQEVNKATKVESDPFYFDVLCYNCISPGAGAAESF